MTLANNTGAAQPISCIGAGRDGRCLGNLDVDPSTAFGIGVDGMVAPMPALAPTLPQPYFPGIGENPPAGEGARMDPDFRPNRSDQVTVSIQRALSTNLTLEFGYIGRRIRNEFLSLNLDAVPYMMTLGGQRFDNAWANLYTAVSSGAAVQPQPWFEAALGGADSAYCKGYSSCTAAVAAKQGSYIKGTRVYSLWTTLQRSSSWTLCRTQPSAYPPQVTSLPQYTTLGFGNYNAAYFSFTARDWNGLNVRSSFTWSRALGTGFRAQSGSSYSCLDQWDFRASYGPQLYDLVFVYNLAMTYQPPFYRSGTGSLGRLLGGRSIAPLFTAQSGAPLRVNTSSGNREAFGLGMSTAMENAVLIGPYDFGNSAHYDVYVESSAGINSNPDRGGSGINMFADPNAVYARFRFQPSNPTVNIDSPASFGVVTGQANMPRRMQSGLRIHF